MERNRVED